MNEKREVVGIDVSKPQLDVALLHAQEELQFANDAAGIEQLVKRLKTLEIGLVVTEATGGC